MDGKILIEPIGALRFAHVCVLPMWYAECGWPRGGSSGPYADDDNDEDASNSHWGPEDDLDTPQTDSVINDSDTD